MVELGTRCTYRKGADRKLSTYRLARPRSIPTPISLRIPEEEISIDNVTGKSDKYKEGFH